MGDPFQGLGIRKTVPSGLYGVALVESLRPSHMIHIPGVLTVRVPRVAMGESAPIVGCAVELVGADYESALEAERF